MIDSRNFAEPKKNIRSCCLFIFSLYVSFLIFTNVIYFSLLSWVAFFRVWEIPRYHVTGTLGRFNPALPVLKSEFESKGVWDMERLYGRQ
jgi:hypothetical protein